VSRRAPQVAVSGGRVCSARTARVAEAVGRALADAGAILVCGGRGGVMAAAARGARRRGGVVVGLLPGYRHAAANADCTITLPTGLGHARNVLVAAAGDVLIALPGSDGTLSEIALARVLGRPVVVLGRRDAIRGTTRAATPGDAVRAALALARTARR